ncbi:MAG TPA: YfhO family protein [Thermoanaerobaculia bacterium]|nr:YfhO family protein [Thermoanaerobaculia bacterium]
MPFILYILTTLPLLFLIHRFIRPLSRRAAIILFVLPLTITGYALLTGGVYGPIESTYQHPPLSALKGDIGEPRNPSSTDSFSQFLPWRRAVQASLERGEWPLWNPYNLSGHLLAGSLQAAPYSPFTLIACLLPAAVSFTYTAAIVLFLAAAGAFILARELDCSEEAALVAAAGWAFAAITLLYLHTAMGFATAYAPLILAATHRVVWQPGLASGALLTTALALCVLAGHPESLFLNVLTAAAWGVVDLIRRRYQPLFSIVTAVAAGLVALLICAVFLLPFFDALPYAGEWTIKARYQSETTRAMPTARVMATLVTNFFPHLHLRYWESPKLGYVAAESATAGSIVLALALYAVVRRRSADKWFFAILAIAGMLAGAQWAPVAESLQALPLLNITHHERLVFLSALALAILAAFGVDELRTRRDAGPFFVAVFLIVALGSFWLERSIGLAPEPGGLHRWAIAAEIFFLGLLIVLWPRLSVRTAPAILLVLLAAQRALTVGGTFATFPAERAYPRLELLEPLRQIREPFRIAGVGVAFPPNTNIFYGLEDPRGYEALTLSAYLHTYRLWSRTDPMWFNRVEDLNAPFLSFLNVRFAIASTEMAIPEGWRKVKEGPNTVLLENERVIPRVFIPRHVVTGSMAAEEVVDRMTSHRDFRETAWITADTPLADRPNGPGTAVLRSRSLGGEYVIDAAMQGDGWIVISDAAWPGWRAYIDGRRVHMQRANAAFLSVYVPQGRHEVRLQYWPDAFVRGRAVTFVTLVGIAAFALWRWRRQWD